MIEFASKSRPIVSDDRFENVGGMYKEAKRLMSRPFDRPGREHKLSIKAREPALKAATKPREPLFKETNASRRALVEALQRESGRARDRAQQVSRPATASKAGKHFSLADKYRRVGNVIEAQKQERLAQEQGRCEWLRYLTQTTLRRARDSRTRLE